MDNLISSPLEEVKVPFNGLFSFKKGFGSINVDFGSILSLFGSMNSKIGSIAPVFGSIILKSGVPQVKL
ncbi:hypothetical protein [Niallia sp. Krafla_26]|uniref:hypothetical protein n=1 Tax=Niallia sp. Krafla_26 TaxID=3064703 RepID=UPI003D177F7E